MSDEQLRHGALDAVVRLLFRHYLAGDLPARLVEWSSLFRAVLAEGASGLLALQRVVQYVLQATDVPIDVLDRVMSEHVSPTMSDMIQTTANRLRAEGLEQGRIAERAEALLHVLAARQIELPAPAEARIRECRDLDQLGRWFHRALVVHESAALFDDE